MDKKKKKLTKKEISVHKKDTVGLFSGKFKTSEFGGKKDKLEKIEKKEKQKGFQKEN